MMNCCENSHTSKASCFVFMCVYCKLYTTASVNVFLFLAQHCNSFRCAYTEYNNLYHHGVGFCYLALALDKLYY